jgi:hypothetical protein
MDALQLPGMRPLHSVSRPSFYDTKTQVFLIFFFAHPFVTPCPIQNWKKYPILIIPLSARSWISQHRLCFNSIHEPHQNTHESPH